MGGGSSNNCERSEQTERLRKAFTGIQSWPPGGGCKAPPCVRIFCILQAKYVYFQALCGLNLQKYMIWGLQGAAKILRAKYT